MDRVDALIIMDGGLAGAIACAMECERGLRVVAWQPPPGGGLSSGGRPSAEAGRGGALVRQQAELYGAVEVVQGGSGFEGPADAGTLLLEAARAAAARGALRVVWPRACGESVDEMFRVTERADLVARLAGLEGEDGAGAGLRLETPFVDLTQEQLLDLARDLEILESVWAARPVLPAVPGIHRTGGSSAVA